MAAVATPPGIPKDQVDLQAVIDWCRKELERRTPDDETRQEVVITASDNKVYGLRIDNTGALDIVLLREP